MKLPLRSPGYRCISKRAKTVNADTHQIIAVELSLSSVTDGEVLPNLQNKHTVKSKQYQVMVPLILGGVMRR